jgi:hypothetical protein
MQDMVIAHVNALGNDQPEQLANFYQLMWTPNQRC